MSVTNFMSVQKADLDLSNRGLVLILGENLDSDAFDSNGGGKSTVFSEAPTWAIFGKTIRGIKGDEVVNLEAKSGTKVALEILDGDTTYLITRHRNHREMGNHVTVHKDGKNITAKSDSDTNDMIVELLQMDYHTFTNSVMFGQSVEKKFTEETDSGQKKILERMLQIGIFQQCKEKATEMHNHESKLFDEVEGEIESLRRNKVSLEESIDELQKKEHELEKLADEKIKSLRADIQLNREELKNIGSTEEKEAKREKVMAEWEKLSKEVDSYKEYENNKQELKAESLSIDKQLRKLNNDIKDNKQKLADVKSGKNIPKICDACGQDLPLDDTSKIEKHLEEAIEGFENEKKEITEENTSILNLIKRVDSVLEKRDLVVKSRDKVNEHIHELNSDIKSNKNMKSQIIRAIEKAEKDIEQQEEMKKTTYTSLIESNLEKIEAIKVELKANTKLLEKYKDRLDKLNFWVNAYGNQGIKSVLLDSVTPFLNTRANKYLSSLAGSSLEVIFNTQKTIKSGEKRDKFSVDVINKNGGGKYKGNSGGEKRRVDVAVNMALQDLVGSRSNKRMDFILYDEVFDSLDAIGCEAVIELLKEKANDFGTVFVITHNDHLKQMFSDSISVSKKNGRTVVNDA